MRPRGNTIRLPETQGGHARNTGFLKLLSRVDPAARNGLGFEGSYLRPGAWVSPEQLRPTRGYPEIPVILASGLMPARGIPGRLRCDSLYVLWRWEPAAHEWRELGRAASCAWEWAVDLRPLAIRALAEARGKREAAAKPNLSAIAHEISTFLDKQLDILEASDRERVLGILHDQFAARLSV